MKSFNNSGKIQEWNGDALRSNDLSENRKSFGLRELTNNNSLENINSILTAFKRIISDGDLPLTRIHSIIKSETQKKSVKLC